MPWHIGPLNQVDDGDDADAKLDAAFEQLTVEEDTERDKGRKASAKAAKAAVKALIKSGAAGDPPYEISVASHPAVPDSGSKPYVSLSVIGSIATPADAETGDDAAAAADPAAATG